MTHFLEAVLSFPTIIFSFFLCLSAVLGLLTIFGGFGLDVGDVEVDVGGEQMNVGEAVGFLSRFGLNGVPITLVISLLSLFGWVVSFLLQSYILNHVKIGIIYYPLGFISLVISLVVAIYITGKICRPLRNIFKSQDAISNRHLIGQVATVRSSSVTGQYGEAVMSDGGAGLILRIRAEEGQEFKRGDRVVLLEFLEEQQGYRIISEDEFKGI